MSNFQKNRGQGGKGVGVKIEDMIKTDTGWVFEVLLGEAKYEVMLEKEYWKKLTGGEMDPGALVRKSFEFLLQREPKESILKSFNLKVIGKYFPEYEENMGRAYS